MLLLSPKEKDWNIIMSVYDKCTDALWDEDFRDLDDKEEPDGYGEINEFVGAPAAELHNLKGSNFLDKPRLIRTLNNFIKYYNKLLKKYARDKKSSTKKTP